MKAIVHAPSEQLARQWQYAVEDLGVEWRCVPVTSADQALASLEEGADVLLLLPGRESRVLLRAVEEHPPLAPPYVLGEDAPDGPLPQAAELPRLLHTWRRQGRLPALTDHHLPATMDIAAALLRTMDAPRRLRAWAFLPEMCALTVVHPPLLHDLQHGLYPLIGAKHGLSASAVERSLRLWVESTWMHGKLSALDRFFGASVDPERGKPTNREFLCRVQERLTLSMQRLL